MKKKLNLVWVAIILDALAVAASLAQLVVAMIG